MKARAVQDARSSTPASTRTRAAPIRTAPALDFASMTQAPNAVSTTRYAIDGIRPPEWSNQKTRAIAHATIHKALIDCEGESKFNADPYTTPTCPLNKNSSAARPGTQETGLRVRAQEITSIKPATTVT